MEEKAIFDVGFFSWMDFNVFVISDASFSGADDLKSLDAACTIMTSLSVIQALFPLA